MTDNRLTLLITCPCGYYDEIPGIIDTTHARSMAKAQGWHYPLILDQPLDANCRIVGKGECRDCYEIDHN
jgi:hypothetical protein